MQIVIENGNLATRALLLEIWKRTGNYSQTQSILKRSYGVIIKLKPLNEVHTSHTRDNNS